ncbi:hypothetical protein TSUD_29960 [Trifolium subterraneum]|uniref:Retrotransposon gag domain-containing protein n=1 Tax=Trifolium subterraneum TaxID=3900 RepID=A0A2Z6M573_TRISU|nr:hypothetical protein TSUD_29960 [Trifolium subterraneum]
MSMLLAPNPSFEIGENPYSNPNPVKAGRVWAGTRGNGFYCHAYWPSPSSGQQRPKSPPRRKQLLLGDMTQGSRRDDYHYRGEDSPRRDETPTHSPRWSDDEVYNGPLSKQIMDLQLPHALQKSPQLGKIFPTTLVEGAMAWYKSLPHGSITSWKDLYKQFTSHFTASRKHRKMEASLEAIVQGPNETLRFYIERFNKEVVQVDVTDDMKKYFMRKNLRDGTKFKEMVTIEKPSTWDEILHKAQAYMNGDRRKHDKAREPRGPPSQFTNYTPLLVPREIVLAECAASNFKNSGIRFPKSTPYNLNL